MKFSLIIPTYNEKENIVVLINRLLKLLKPFDYEIIVVDDNSPDKTWKVAQERFIKNKRVRVIRRMNKKGLSSAITHGFDKAKGDFVGVIDADMQHDEKILPKMIKNTEKYDLVVGSRLVKGGGVRNWSWFRKIESRIAAWLPNLLLGIKVKDNGSGYFIVKKSIYNKVKHKMCCRGYKPLLEITFFANIENLKEVPYIFGPRKKGKSKLGAITIIEYALMVMNLFFIRVAGRR